MESYFRQNRRHSLLLSKHHHHHHLRLAVTHLHIQSSKVLGTQCPLPYVAFQLTLSTTSSTTVCYMPMSVKSPAATANGTTSCPHITFGAYTMWGQSANLTCILPTTTIPTSNSLRPRRSRKPPKTIAWCSLSGVATTYHTLSSLHTP
jgi:hypothetical protein